MYQCATWATKNIKHTIAAINQLQADGIYLRMSPQDDQPARSAQTELLTRICS